MRGNDEKLCLRKMECIINEEDELRENVEVNEGQGMVLGKGRC